MFKLFKAGQFHSLWGLMCLMYYQTSSIHLAASARAVAFDKFSVLKKEQKFETNAKDMLGSSLDMLHSLIPKLERARPTSEAPAGREAFPVVTEERGIFAELIKYREQRRGSNTLLHLLRLHSMKSIQDRSRSRGGRTRIRIQATPDFEDEELQLMMPVKPKFRTGKKASGKRNSSPPHNAYGPAFNLSPVQNQPMAYPTTIITQETEGSGTMNTESSSNNENVQVSKGCEAKNCNVNKIVTHSAADKGLHTGPLPPTEMLPSKPMKDSVASSPTSPTYETISTTSPLNSKSVLSRLTVPSAVLKELNYSLPTDITQENGNFTIGTTPCRPGYTLEKGSCRSICELTPNYCQNGGRCLILQDVGPLCKCIQNDDIWYKGERCESFLTEFQLNCIIAACCLLLFILLLLLPVLILKTSGRKLSRPLLGSTSKLWIPSLAPQMSQSFSTLSEASDVTEQTTFGSLPRLSTFFDTERYRPLPTGQKQPLIVCEDSSSTSDFHTRLLPDYQTKVPTDPRFWMTERTPF
ncbi:uncharacterized protein LOC115481672 [Microcaecilia unicolor]|uniref:Uncharacterized protein LOC115481672 n=1 Tax=Microcaecilia unicolor TaxID=1415580 RepID=A0A6P7ZG44_9AMPH|nr:uncharacterized protein LOC115481672 [Microcaecilia unicolor]